MVPLTPEKECGRCKKVRPLADFNKERRKKDGHSAWCRDCHKEWRREGGEMLREKYRAALQRTRYAPAGRIKTHLYNARRNAERVGVSFSLTRDDLPPYPGHCPCCQVLMEYGAAWRVSPTIDRIIPSRGYVPGNIQWLCHRCNRLKNDGTPEELMMIALFMQKVVEGLDSQGESSL